MNGVLLGLWPKQRCSVRSARKFKVEVKKLEGRRTLCMSQDETSRKRISFSHENAHLAFCRIYAAQFSHTDLITQSGHGRGGCWVLHLVVIKAGMFDIAAMGSDHLSDRRASNTQKPEQTERCRGSTFTLHTPRGALLASLVGRSWA